MPRLTEQLNDIAGSGPFFHILDRRDTCRTVKEASVYIDALENLIRAQLSGVDAAEWETKARELLDGEGKTDT